MNKLDPTIEELLDLKKTFKDKKTYTGEMVKQVIDARIESLGVKSAAPKSSAERIWKS